MRKSLLTLLLLLSLFVAACGTEPVQAPPQTPDVTSPSNPETPTLPDPNQNDNPPDPGQQPPPTQPDPPPTTTPDPPTPTEPTKPGDQPKPKPNPTLPSRQVPEAVRGIHVSGWYGGRADLLNPLADWALSAGLNTMVLDLKAEDGQLSWVSDIPLAIEIGANLRKISDLPALVAELHQKGFWVVGRIVVMNDQFLYRARPDWTIPGFTGGPYSFMDPHNQNVWRYNLDIALAAAEAGIDEIQWDYIRFPERLVDGYNRDTGADYRTGAINDFLNFTVSELRPLGVLVSADLFGLTTSVAEGDDMQIGQDYRQVAEIVDFVSAMAYPSHYDPGTYGIPSPDHSPYETILASMGKALERTEGIPVARHRPWIQDFHFPGPDAQFYGPEQIVAQVRALQELGIRSFMLWDPSNKYTRDVDFTSIQ